MKQTVKDNSESLSIEELVKQRPKLTEDEMAEIATFATNEIAEFCTYEEAVAEALQMYDEEVRRIWKEYDSRQTKEVIRIESNEHAEK